MKIHYPNLNPLRFIAASLVIIAHLEELRAFNGATHQPPGVLFNSGNIGVNLFFVLSGFLITSLLIKEKEAYGRVAIRKFYMRRVLRIWPLYFIIVLLALFVLPRIPLFYFKGLGVNPQDELLPNLLLFTLFLPNVQKLVIGSVPYAAQTWSIGVEEQYYLFWPLIVNKTNNLRQLTKVIVVMIIVYLVMKVFLIISVPKYLNGPMWVYAIRFFKRYFQFDCLLVGSLFAIINISAIKTFLTQKRFQLFVYIVLLVVYITNFDYRGFSWEVYSVLFGLMILNLVNSTSLINMEYPWLSYLGKISYGLYMYHYIVVALVIRLITTNRLLVYLYVFAGTIILATLSYELIEKRFLNIKSKKYALLKTG